MSLWLAAIVAVVVTAVAVGAMLLMRRHAPAGGYFEDGDRAAGVFGVIATGFAVLAGFVVFLAFESFDTSRSGAETEARTVAQQFETAQFLPAPMRTRVSGELVCYARAVVHREWPRMQSGTLGEAPNPWGVAVFRSLGAAEPRSPSEQAAFSKYLDQRADRETARGDRIHGAEGVIPAALWAVLFVSAATVFVFLLMFADSGERAAVQGVMMGGPSSSSRRCSSSCRSSTTPIATAGAACSPWPWSTRSACWRTRRGSSAGSTCPATAAASLGERADLRPHPVVREAVVADPALVEGCDRGHRDADRLDSLGQRVVVPALVVLGRGGEEDLVALAALGHRADRGGGVLAAVDQRDRLTAGRALHELVRDLRCPVGIVGMPLRRDHQRDLAAGAGALLDRLQQPGGGLGAVGDHEQPPGL